MTSHTFNDAFGDLIRHLKFQMRKVLETRNLNKATRQSSPEGRGYLGTRLAQHGVHGGVSQLREVPEEASHEAGS